ncbi:AMP-binding protein [Nocardioides humilatus]|uniref:AMP-binding protein n=1 Tax=Nocardioides humilatus TaxID=2607660 RepID=A0A5B1LMB1_9ACTN|nr:AMP-binding protein [Nocardioides humilatus]KAA1420940.1 AMP-binding protein [Nocardioides humilatus]
MKRSAELARRIALEGQALAALTRAGMVRLDHPARLLAVMRAMGDYGPFGSAVRIAALRHPDRAAIIDERGSITFGELEDSVNRLANALRGLGLEPGATVGVLCRNHRQPLLTAFAASRAGLNVVWLNTAFSRPQAEEVSAREGVDLLIHDADLTEVVAGVAPPYGRIVCAIDAPTDDLDALLATAEPTLPPAPAKPGRIILLTSGTTGTPKGAPRPEPRGFILPGALLDRMPMRSEGVTVIGPPLFHGTGLILALLSVGLGSTLVLRREFDAAQFLDDVEQHRATTVCVVPVMLQRVLALGEEDVRRRDLSSLSVAFCAGSQLPADVALRTMDLMGEVIYNLYGSTEVSVATLATPADLRAAPTSVGRAALGSRVRLYDDAGHPAAKGERGRIFVGTTTPFEGYTGGGGKEVIDGLLSTGDVGHFDEQGRLHIDGRDDDMIVSGGENVFPAEVEGLLLTHPAVTDAAVIGVDDPDFGQRLRAFVVVREAVDAPALQDFVKANLARYKVPRDVVFVEEIPRNPTGKILKRALAADVT